MLRILHVGLGPLGRRVGDDLASRRLGRVVAAVDTDPSLAGTTFGQARVTTDLAEALDSEFDAAIVTTSSDLGRCADTFRALLERGTTVVSTCEELLWPWLRHEELAHELDALARSNGGRLLGTGINPGYLMDALPVVATAACNAVRRIDGWLVQDATTRRVTFQQKIGAALDLEAFAEKARSGSLRHVGLGESLHLVAHRLGLGVVAYDETLEPVVATRELACALGPIHVGRAAGVKQVGTGRDADGEVVARLEFRASIGESEPHDRVVVTGDPPVDLVIQGGVHGDVGTSAMVLNSIRPLLDAEPGLHTMATIRLPGFDPGVA
ncbi:MAG: dihydrodipicolinate reductase [Planctomycetota bacterium]